MYKDRGIIKWAPFDALVGFGDLITDVKHNLGKTAKPILMEDKLQELDLSLQEALQENKEIEIEYFEDGYLKTVSDKIKKLDGYNNNLILESLIHIKIDCITNITI